VSGNLQQTGRMPVSQGVLFPMKSISILQRKYSYYFRLLHFLAERGVDGRIPLTWVLKKYSVKVWARFNGLRIECNAGVLRKRQ
jgi:hypothetical protein